MKFIRLFEFFALGGGRKKRGHEFNLQIRAAFKDQKDFYREVNRSGTSFVRADKFAAMVLVMADVEGLTVVGSCSATSCW